MTTSSVTLIKRSIYETSDGMVNLESENGYRALLAVNAAFILGHLLPSCFRLNAIYRIIFIVCLSIFLIIEAILYKKVLENDAIFNENLKNNNIKYYDDGQEGSGKPDQKKYGLAILILLIINIVLIIIHIILIFSYKPIPKKQQNKPVIDLREKTEPVNDENNV